jgi:hypothetical protein
MEITSSQDVRFFAYAGCLERDVSLAPRPSVAYPFSTFYRPNSPVPEGCSRRHEANYNEVRK